VREELAESLAKLAPLRETAAQRDQNLEKASARVTELECALSDAKNCNTELQSEIARLKEAALPAENLAKQVLIPRGHYYSPVVDPEDDWVQRAMEKEAEPAENPEEFGIDEAEMLRWFDKIAGHYPSNPFPEHPAPGSLYHYANSNFPLADALALLGFMLDARPRRFIEVGAGYSSCAAIDINEQHLGGETRMTFIEPFPETALKLFGNQPQYRERLLQQRLQDTPLSLFTELEAGDILFIDSSHVGKTGSDVLDYLFRIFPQLNSGVLVHIHDIFYPFEYPREWFTQLDRSWNEAYFLRAFLHGNPAFRVLYLSDWIYKCRRDLLEARMPLCVQHRGGSLWLRVVGR
jgi:hypothetical protein